MNPLLSFFICSVLFCSLSLFTRPVHTDGKIQSTPGRFHSHFHSKLANCDSVNPHLHIAYKLHVCLSWQSSTPADRVHAFLGCHLQVQPQGKLAVDANHGEEVSGRGRCEEEEEEQWEKF